MALIKVALLFRASLRVIRNGMFVQHRGLPSASTNLEALVTKLTADIDDEKLSSETSKTVPVTVLKEDASIEKTLTCNGVAALLSRSAAFAHTNDAAVETRLWLKEEVLPRLNQVLENTRLDVDATLEALSAIISLELTGEMIFNTLLQTLRNHFSEDFTAASVSRLVGFASVVHNKKVRLPDDVYKQTREWLQLKANEITKPEDIISVMICWNRNDSWFNMFVEKAKGSIGFMSAGELIGMIACLANNCSRPTHTLRLICAALDENKQTLLLNQLLTLAHSVAKLRFMDARLHKLLAEQIFAHITNFKKWSQVNMAVESLAKLRIGDMRAWKALAAWINNNQMNAELAELSYAVHWCAIAGVGQLILESAELLREKLDRSAWNGAKTWLSTIYALAVCDRLTAPLAQTVLDKVYVNKLLEGLNPWQQLMALTTVLQIQSSLLLLSGKDCTCPPLKIDDYMHLSPTTLNEMALKLRYGKNEEGNVLYFHSLLQKLYPSNAQLSPPVFNEDGIYVNATVKMSSSDSGITADTVAEMRNIAIIYLSWKEKLPSSYNSEEYNLTGPASLAFRLLKARGFIPVSFSQEELEVGATLKEQFDIIRNKLEEAYLQPLVD